MRWLIPTLLLALSAPPASADRLDKVMKAYWDYQLSQNPVQATTQGVRNYDDRLGSLSLKSMDKRKDRYEDFLEDVEDIDPEKLAPDARLNHALLSRDLRQNIAMLSYPQRAMLFTRFYGWHFEAANLVDTVPFFTMADYESYIARLNDFSRLNSEGIATTRWAIREGMVQPCASMEGYDSTISNQITGQPEDSRFWQPFLSRPASIDKENWKRLKALARTAITDRVMPALRTWQDVFTREYMASCAKEVGVSALSRGEDYYAALIKRHTTLSLSARQIHQIGLSEVSRIRREMRAVIEEANFDGDFQEFQAFLRGDPRFYAKTGDTLLRATALIAKKADGALPRLFGTLPRMPYTVKPIPTEIAKGNTTAYYEAPAGDGTRAGVYRVNLTDLDQRPLFELEALTLHEAVPGHHLQIALQQELTDIPDFRRYGGYNAYIEGWGLYAERLGLEMGFYEDPYANFGRLSYEMWRACRLVVDTGLHALGWTRQQAIDYMADNTALSQTNITSEVDRYITWPAQALSYKLGEIKIRDLRALAERELGDGFDIRAFHDVVLAQGSLPLPLLERQVYVWIEANGGTVPQRRTPQEQRGKRKKVKK